MYANKKEEQRRVRGVENFRNVEHFGAPRAWGERGFYELRVNEELILKSRRN